MIHANVDWAIKHLMERVLGGKESSPRGKKIREVIGSMTTFDMRHPLVTLKARNLGYRFAPAEAAWILSGDNRLDVIKKYSPFIWEFSDDGFFYSGAYGPRVVDQLTYVCDMLAEDPDTRQAVIDVWRPNPRKGRDIPCTLSYQFLAREDKLHVVQSMRSSDAWLGYPYDAFNATMLAGYVILLLRHRKTNRRTGLKMGTHTMVVGSQHLYEPDWERARELTISGSHHFVCPTFDPETFNDPNDLVDHLWKLANKEWDRCHNSFLVTQLMGLDKSG